ncbi:hypothetical protein OIU78_001101 [Salix suchowensis]|nr:hypothetical protein OIU78_001101 [Salix suchowensis]
MEERLMVRVSSAGEKIGGQVLEVTKILERALNVQKELLIKIKQTQKPDLAGLAAFLKPLNEPGLPTLEKIVV